MKKLLSIFFSLTAVLLLCSSFAAHASPPGLSAFSPSKEVKVPPIYSWTLDNGLKVFFWENHTVPLAAVKVGIKTGSAFEGKYQGAGISHYVEHVVCSGSTKWHTEDEYKKELKNSGLTENAYTNTDMTVYENSGPARNLEVMLRRLAEYVQGCAFNPYEVKREKGVITQEIMKDKEEPGRILWRTFAKAFFMSNGMKDPIIGYLNLFSKLTREDLIDYYSRRYKPDSAVVAVAGDASPDEVIKIVKKLFGKWEKKAGDEPTTPDASQVPSAPVFIKKKANVGESMFSMGFNGPQYKNLKEILTARMLSLILGGLPTSRLKQALILDKNPVASSIYTYVMSGPKWGSVIKIGGSYSPSKETEVFKRIHRVINKIKKKGITHRELDTAIKVIARSLKTLPQEVDEQADTMINFYFKTSSPYPSPYMYSLLKTISRQDIKKAAQKYLIPERAVTVVIEPKNKFTTTQTIKNNVKKDVLGKWNTTKLPNGVAITTRKDNSTSKIDVYLTVKGGYVYEPKGKDGLAKFTARYLMEGNSRWRTYSRFTKEMMRSGIYLSTNTGAHTITVHMDVLPESLDKGLNMLKQALFHPTFPAESEKKLKQIQLAEIRAENDHWQREAYNFFKKVFYGQHPYSKSINGTLKSVKSFKAQDASRYWHSVFKPSRVTIAAAGPVDEKVLLEKLKRLFSSMSGKSSITEVSPPQIHKKPGFYKKISDRKQETILIGFSAPGWTKEHLSKDFPALKVATAILGGTGGLDGRLPTALRGKRNLAYIAGAGYHPYPTGGAVRLMSQCRPENAEKVKNIMLAEAKRIARGEFTKQEVKTVKQALLDKFYFSIETQERRTNSSALDILFGRDAGTFENFRNQLSKVTFEDVKRAAAKYFKNPQVVFVGPVDVKNSKNKK